MLVPWRVFLVGVVYPLPNSAFGARVRSGAASPGPY